jgi:hypothetical protein
MRVCLLAVLLPLASFVVAADSPDGRIKTVSTGERVEVGAILEPGKKTILEFYADW